MTATNLDQPRRVTTPRRAIADRRPTVRAAVEPLDIMLPSPPWPLIHRELARAYGFCQPTACEYRHPTEPLAVFPRWRYEPHARRSPVRYQELGNELACGIQWLALEETPQERAQWPSLYLTNRPTSEVRPFRNANGECCEPDSLMFEGGLWWRCPVCQFRLRTIAGGAGQVYWISPLGFDGNSGTNSTIPVKTWSRAFGLLTPGDTLMVMDGTYSPSANGLFKNPPSGSSGNVVLITAEHERVPTLTSDGMDDTVTIQSRNNITVRGLALENLDNTAALDYLGAACTVYGSDSIRIERCLGRHNNRSSNVHIFSMDTSTHCLVEECEAYEFVRHSFGLFPDFCTFRRNYAMARGYRITEPGKGPQTGGYLYGGSDNIWENHMTEGAAFGTQSQYRLSFRNRVLGHLALGTPGVADPTSLIGGMGFASSSHTYDLNGQAGNHDDIIENAFALGVSGSGGPITTLDCANMTIRNCTDINGSGRGFQCYREFWGPGDPAGAQVMSWHGKNLLAVNCPSNGFSIQDNDAPSDIANSNSFNCGSDSLGRNMSGTVNHTNPQIGIARPWLPDASPMKGAGVGGVWSETRASAADIGANVLYAYEDGLLTAKPLWGAATGEYILRGATKAGWNDLAGTSLFDVHTRFNVTPSAFPAGYQGGTGGGGTTVFTILGRSPVAAATNIHPRSGIMVRLSQEVDAASVTTTTFTLKQGSTIIPATVTGPEVRTGILTLRPASPLATSTIYTVTLKGGPTGITGPGGFQFASDQTWTFTTASTTAAAALSLWTTETPASQGAVSSQQLTLATAFRVDATTLMEGIRVYKPGGPDGRTAVLFRMSDGAALSSQPFSNEAASGLEFQAFPTAVTLSPDITYAAAVILSQGCQWGFTEGYFATARDLPSLHGLSIGVIPGNGLYAYGQTGSPTEWGTASYFVDPILAGGAPLPPVAGLKFTPARTGGRVG